MLIMILIYNKSVLLAQSKMIKNTLALSAPIKVRTST